MGTALGEPVVALTAPADDARVTRALERLGLEAETRVPALDLLQQGRAEAGVGAALEQVAGRLADLATRPRSFDVCVAMLAEADRIGFVDDADRRRAAFEAWVATGRCADSLDEPGPPFRERIGGRVVDIAWAQAATIFAADPTVAIDETLRERLESEAARLANERGTDVIVPTTGAWTVRMNGVVVQPDKSGRMAIPWTRHDVQLVHADGSLGPSLRLQLAGRRWEPVGLAGKLVVEVVDELDDEGPLHFYVESIEAFVALHGGGPLHLAVVRGRRIRIWTWDAGGQRFCRAPCVD